MRASNDVTLVVTAHRLKFLREAMASVGSQTTSEFHLVCCADRTGEDGVAELFCESVTHMAIASTMILEVDGGTAGAVRNAGFAASRTAWTCYLDGDDLLRPEALAVMRSAIDSEAADIYCSGMFRLSTKGVMSISERSLTYFPPLWIYWRDAESVGHETYFNQFQAIRTEMWWSQPFDETTNGEDIDFMLHQLLRGKFLKVPELLYIYRDNPGSFSKQQFSSGDVCTQRYASGYYARMLYQMRGSLRLQNFQSLMVPASSYGMHHGRHL